MTILSSDRVFFGRGGIGLYTVTLAITVLLRPDSAAATTWVQDRLVVWPSSGQISEVGFLWVQGEGSWRRDVEHLPLYDLHFVGGGRRIRASATRLTPVGARRVQVTITADKPLVSGITYRLEVDPVSSCGAKRPKAFMPGLAPGRDAEWVVNPSNVNVGAIQLDSVQNKCAGRDCSGRRLVFVFESGDVLKTGQLVFLRSVEPSSGELRTFGILASDDASAVWDENPMMRDLTGPAYSKACFRAQLVGLSGELGLLGSTACVKVVDAKAKLSSGKDEN